MKQVESGVSLRQEPEGTWGLIRTGNKRELDGILVRNETDGTVLRIRTGNGDRTKVGYPPAGNMPEYAGTGIQLRSWNPASRKSRELQRIRWVPAVLL